MRGKRHIAQNACISLCGARRLKDIYYHFCVYISHAPFCEPTDVSDGAIVSPDTFAADSRGRLSLQFAGCIDCGSHFEGRILRVVFCGSHFAGRIAGFILRVALRVPVWFAFCDRIYGLPFGL